MKKCAGERAAHGWTTTGMDSWTFSCAITFNSTTQPRHLRGCGNLSMERRAGDVRAARIEGRHRRPLPEQWGRHVHGYFREVRNPEARTALFDYSGFL